MYCIALTQGQVALVDDIDADLDQWKWRANKYNCNIFYALRTLPRRNEKRPVLYMHRVIAERMGIKTPDHINRNGLDNRRSNLREATRSQNNANQDLRSDNTSGQKGVWWIKAAQKWRTAIEVNKKVINFGRFENILDAAKAYNDAAIKYFGEFAVLNKV